MTGNEIISNAVDMAGASLVDKLETHTAVLHYLNALSDRNLQLANSSRGQRFYEISDDEITSESGNFADTTFRLRPTHVRYRLQPDASIQFPKWVIIDIVDTIEELTRAANNGQRAIFFSAISPLSYRLSWAPEETLAVQIFGKRLGADEDDLSAEPDFPNEFGDLLSVEIAMHMLDEVLLLDDAKRYQAFVESRSLKLQGRFQRLEWIWNVYRSNASESQSISRPYNVWEDYNEAIEEVGGMWP